MSREFTPLQVLLQLQEVESLRAGGRAIREGEVAAGIKIERTQHRPVAERRNDIGVRQYLVNVTEALRKSIELFRHDLHGGKALRTS